MNKRIKSAIGWILYLALLIGLVLGVPRGLVYVLKTDYPMASITSGSMWPALKQGDLVLVKGIESKDEIGINDIVIYKNSPSAGSGQATGFTIHRVIELKETTLITKGDANNVNDAPVGYEEVIGKVLTFGDRLAKIPMVGGLGLLINKAKAQISQ